ncbi:Predicted acetyltransferase involved in intracellular survival and related acetyltransferases [Serratia plymuthica]|nr:Predicted acetyltransferase involved in intracellular survival and related acetyltransferases [Serratia plymuthica]VEI17701.1 Predicted acetyltransferase involved in intracellular survival and related acetyltransferases [Serratia plymuthica]
MRIERLSAHRQRIGELAALLHQEWRDFSPWSSHEKISQRFEQRCEPQHSGMTLLALSPQQHILGTASLVIYDLADKPERKFWLGEVFTHPQHRGLGIARRLIDQCITHCKQKNIAELYLYTPDQQSLYQKLGWQPVEQRQVSGEEVTVMCRTL